MRQGVAWSLSNDSLGAPSFAQEDRATRHGFEGLASLGVFCAACFLVPVLHVRGFGACGESQFSNLFLKIGGGLHQSCGEGGIGSCFCHFEQRCRGRTCMEVILGHGYSHLTLCFAYAA
jgi:hypothetical protein